MASQNATDEYVLSTDGLRLHALCWKPATPARETRPVLCLPGLTRTAEDFIALAGALAADKEKPRRVIALDYRGRGRSDYDADPANYSLPVELGDVMTVMAVLDAAPAVIVGTSRGGILAMLLASLRRESLAGVVLNDIGPVIDIAGLMRIKSYVGKLPQPETFDDAAEILRRQFASQFPNLTAKQWGDSARRAFRQWQGRLEPTHDYRIAATLDLLTPDAPMPDLWKEFEALAGLPVMVVRGGLSDLLSVSTLCEMAARHPGLETLEIPDQGHAPLLAERDTITRIAAFVRRCA